MIGIEVKGKMLDIYPDTSIRLTINSPIYTGGEPTNIEGSYTFPFNLPLSDHNSVVLDYPDIAANANTTLLYEGVQLYAEGLPLLKGDLILNNAGNSEEGRYAKASIIFNPFKKAKETSIRDCDLYVDTFNTTFEARVKAIDTVNNPLNHPYLYAPIINRTLQKSGSTGDEFYHHITQNFWDPDTGGFTESDKHRAVTPFVRAEYLFKKVVDYVGHALDDQFFDEEMKTLCFYNNNSIADETGAWSPVIDLAEAVPDIEVNEFLKAFSASFFAALIPDIFSGTLLLARLRDIATAAPEHDWTDQATPYHGKVINLSSPKNFAYAKDPNENDNRSFADQPVNPDKLAEFDHYSDYASDLTTPSDYMVYLKETPQYFWRWGATDNRFYHRPYDVRYKGDKTYTVPIRPMYPGLVGRIDDFYNQYTLQIDYNVNTYTEVEEEKKSAAPLSLRSFFYRGMQANKNGKLYPMASIHTFNYNRDRVGNYSLNLYGDDGIINQWGKEWLFFLENRRTINRIINLSIKDILNFKPQHKVRIENMNYFVSKLDVTITNSGLQPVNCTLESTL